MDWPRLTFGTRPTLALPEACCTQLAMRLGREPAGYPIRHARPGERFGIRGTIPLSRACLSLFELLSFRQIIPPDRALTTGHHADWTLKVPAQLASTRSRRSAPPRLLLTSFRPRRQRRRPA